jgi:hypothetical protein
MKKATKQEQEMLRLYKQTQSRVRPRSAVMQSGKDRSRSRNGRKAETRRILREET